MRHESILTVLFRHRGVLLLLLAVPIVATSLRPHEIGSGALAIGVGVVATGVALRLASLRRIGRGARVHRPHAREVIATGPYRWTRNPLYLATTAMVAGFGVLAGLGWKTAGLVALTLLAYTPVVIAEEEALTTLFGEVYQRYVDSVPRWIGTPRCRSATIPGKLVPWGEILRREKWLVPGSAAAVLLISALGRERVGLTPGIQHIERALRCNLALAAGVAMIAACVPHTIKVEIHQRRRRHPKRRPITLPHAMHAALKTTDPR